MDSFIKIIEQKKDEPVATLHTKQIELLKKYVQERKNVFICGASGVGKTYVLKSVLNDYNSVEVEKEHLRSKSLFLTFIKTSPKHTYIDDYDSDFKSLIEKVSDGDRVSRGAFVVTSTNMCMFPNFETIFIPKHKPEQILTLIDDKSTVAENAAIRCNGNIRDFFTYLDGYDEKDIFKSPKEYIKDILSDPTPIGIPHSIHEHGHVWDIFQENFLDSKGVNIVPTVNAFSEADVYDTHMYTSGDWYLMPYFTLNAIIIPKLNQGKPLERDKIRPGSCWTKYGNFKMRNQKYKEIQKRYGHNLCIEDLCLIKNYAENGDLRPMIAYGLTPQDFDVMNHLAVGSKLKQRDVSKVKKALTNAYEQRKDY